MSDRTSFNPVLSVRELIVQVATTAGARRVVDGVSFDLALGKTLCLAGESGSGKSMTALALMRLLPEPAARIGGGTVLLGGRNLVALPERQMREVRGNDIAMIFQEPMTSLNPVLSIGHQLGEAVRAHHKAGAAEIRERVLQALADVRIADPVRRLKQYPHELSGGMRQRVMIAMALTGDPKVLIADEPTTALDVTIQAQILELMRELQAKFGTALLLITHDMGVVAEMADDVLVMRSGKIVEAGDVQSIFALPEADYTKRLLAAVPRLGALAGRDQPMRAKDSAASADRGPIIDVADLVVRFDIRTGVLRRVVNRVHAVEGISFAIGPGETLALVGESGCGKSTTGRAIMGLVARQGSIRVGGRETTDLGHSAMRRVRRDVQMIFQDPYASLDPRVRVGDLVGEPLRIHRLATGSALEDRVAWLFGRVGLSRDYMRRHPHELSGGQRQRIAIARALSLSPKAIVADEAVSALDVSVRAQVLDLLQELQDELGLSYLFISHDMAVIEQVSHRVAVMYLGQIVEMGSRRQIFEDPRHPYTRRLLDAVPIADPEKRRGRFRRLEGEVPSSLRAVGDEPKRVMLSDVGEGHLVAMDAAMAPGPS